MRRELKFAKYETGLPLKLLSDGNAIWNGVQFYSVVVSNKCGVAYAFLVFFDELTWCLVDFHLKEWISQTASWNFWDDQLC